jgi:hypothetical protein
METYNTILRQQFDLQTIYSENKRKYKLEKNRAEKKRDAENKLRIKNCLQEQPSNNL